MWTLLARILSDAGNIAARYCGWAAVVFQHSSLVMASSTSYVSWQWRSASNIYIYIYWLGGAIPSNVGTSLKLEDRKTNLFRNSTGIIHVDLSISVSTQALSKGYITPWSGRCLLSLLWHWQVAKQGCAEHNEIWFSDVPRTMAMCWFSRRKRSFRAEICRDFRSEMGPTLINPKYIKLTLPNAEKSGTQKDLRWQQPKIDRCFRRWLELRGPCTGPYGWKGVGRTHHRLVGGFNQAGFGVSINANWFTWHYWQLKRQQWHLRHQGFQSHSQLP